MDEYDYNMHANKVIIDLFASRGKRLVSLSCNINMCIYVYITGKYPNLLIYLISTN